MLGKLKIREHRKNSERGAHARGVLRKHNRASEPGRHCMCTGVILRIKLDFIENHYHSLHRGRHRISCVSDKQDREARILGEGTLE